MRIYVLTHGEDAAAEAARGLVTSCESDAQGGEELGAEMTNGVSKKLDGRVAEE